MTGDRNSGQYALMQTEDMTHEIDNAVLTYLYREEEPLLRAAAYDTVTDHAPGLDSADIRQQDVHDRLDRLHDNAHITAHLVTDDITHEFAIGYSITAAGKDRYREQQEQRLRKLTSQSFTGTPDVAVADIVQLLDDVLQLSPGLRQDLQGCTSQQLAALMKLVCIRNFLEHRVETDRIRDLAALLAPQIAAATKQQNS